VTRPLVSVVMGSDSDWPVMRAAAEALAEFAVPTEARVVSAHRTPRDMVEWAEAADGRGVRVIVAGAGGAAHLPGMVASLTPLPVIGVPVPLRHLDGLDSLLSIVQMPAGVPVATVSIGGARNAGLLAVRILAAADPELLDEVRAFQTRLADSARAKDAALQDELHRSRADPRGPAGCAAGGRRAATSPRRTRRGPGRARRPRCPARRRHRGPAPRSGTAG
jgi:5-(carboxyamino)imidazole ribonucleotide mutase